MLNKFNVIIILIVALMLSGCGNNFQNTAEKKAVEFVKIYEKISNGDMTEQSKRDFLSCFVPIQRDFMTAWLPQLLHDGYTLHSMGVSMVFEVENVVTNYVKDIPDGLQEASVDVTVKIKASDKNGIDESKGIIHFIMVGKGNDALIYDWTEDKN